MNWLDLLFLVTVTAYHNPHVMDGFTGLLTETQNVDNCIHSSEDWEHN